MANATAMSGGTGMPVRKAAPFPKMYVLKNLAPQEPARLTIHSIIFASASLASAVQTVVIPLARIIPVHAAMVIVAMESTVRITIQETVIVLAIPAG